MIPHAFDRELWDLVESTKVEDETIVKGAEDRVQEEEGEEPRRQD